MMQKRAVCIRGEKCNPLTHKSRLNCALFHHATLTPEEIADKSEITYSRLKNYASESQANDLIPFKALVRFCAVTARWDVIDAELNSHHRGVAEFEVAPTADALNESIDVSTAAARVLEQVRELAKDGSLDAADRSKVRDMLRTMRSEVEQLDASLDAPAPSHLRSITR